MLNLFLLASTWIYALASENGDVNAAGMIFTVTLPQWILVSIINIILVGLTIPFDNLRKKILILSISAVLSLAYVIYRHSPFASLIGIWIGLAALIDLWTLTRKVE